MYRLTPRMRQILRRNLKDYHDLFSGGGCSGTCLEELIFQSIRLDHDAYHYPTWKQVGHDNEADICVTVNGETYPLDIKSGIVKGGYLNLSGPRLGRFEGDLEQITAYLNNRKPEVLSVSWHGAAEDSGRYRYQIMYVDAAYLHDLNPSNWKKIGRRSEQENQYGVIFRLNPAMGWKLQWEVPEELVDISEEFFV